VTAAEWAAHQAEQAAIDLVRQAGLLFEFADEARHTDPRPDDLREAAETLDAHAADLRALYGVVWGRA
jgi:hypothetical protein